MHGAVVTNACGVRGVLAQAVGVVTAAAQLSNSASQRASWDAHLRAVAVAETGEGHLLGVAGAMAVRAFVRIFVARAGPCDAGLTRDVAGR